MVTDMRTQLARTATRLVEEDPRAAVVLSEISADRFARAMRSAPDRVVNVGIMEQTLVGVGAGFAMEGFHPIVHTMAPFLVERPFEQVKVDFGYQGLGGTLASVGAPYDYGTEGGTHHSPGDVGVVLTVPGTDVLVPGCAVGARAARRTTTRSTWNRVAPASSGGDHARPSSPSVLCSRGRSTRRKGSM